MQALEDDTNTPDGATAETAETPATAVAPIATGAHPPLSLRVNFSWTFLGNVVYAACQWGILVVLAKLGSPAMVGQFALGLAVTAPVMMFSQLQLRAVQATDAKREYQFGDYLALRLITTALALLVIGGIVAVSGFRRETALVVLIVGAMKGVDALSDVYFGLWQQHERMDGIARAMMLNGAVSVTALAVLMLATRDIVTATLGSAAGSATALAYTLARNRRMALAHGPDARPRWQWSNLKCLGYLTLPLGVVALLLSLNANIPRYYIQHYAGEAELGIYAAIGYIMAAGSTVIGSLGHSSTPRLARYYADRDANSYRRLLRKLLLFGAALGVTGVVISLLWGREILTISYKAEYGKAVFVFLLLMVAASIDYIASVFRYALLGARLFHVQLYLFGLITVITLLFSWILISRFGLAGAAWTAIAASFVQLIVSIAIVARAIRRLET